MELLKIGYESVILNERSCCFPMESQTKPTHKHLTKKPLFRWLIAVMCMLALLLTSVPLVSLQAAASTPVYVKTETTVNLRTGAGTQYSTLQVLKKDTTVTLLDRSNTDWYKVRLGDGTTGYCYANNMDVLNDCKSTDYLNFRTGPSTDYSIIRTLVPGTRLNIICFSGGLWLKAVAPDGVVGYVCTDYVEYIADASIKVTTSTSQAAASSFTLSQTTAQIARGRKLILSTSGAKGTVEWTSSDETIARFVSDGVFKGVSDGKVTITATDTKTKQSLTCQLTVVATDYRFVYLSDSARTLEEGQNFTLSVATEPEGGKYTLRSSDTTVATVSDAGVVKGVGGGKAVITASDSTGIVTASCQVTVNPQGSISFSSSYLSVYAGSSVRIGVTKTPVSMALVWNSTDNNVASVNNGLVSGLRAGTAIITASDSTGKIKAKCVVTVNGVNSGYVSLSRYQATTTAGKTIYIQGYNGSQWSTSDSSIATVWDGFIETKMPGRVAVSYTNSYGQKAICVVTVTEPAPIRFSYSSPNSATLSSKITLVAITDTKRSGVYFSVQDGTTPTIVQATSKTAEGNTYIWKGTYTPKQAGTFTVKAYAKYNNAWSTCSDGTSKMFIANKYDPTEVDLKRLRASDGVIKFIASNEGYVPRVVYDNMSYGLDPTLGHGYVVHEGECFYNNVTLSEAYALLVETVNEKCFATDVNNMLINNYAYFNQQQFDALLSFSYNLGTGWTYGSDLKDIILSGYAPNGSRNLNYVGRNKLIREMLAYHHAGGNCYYGLLYRRADELEMFLYGDYVHDGSYNKHGFPSPYCISF